MKSNIKNDLTAGRKRPRNTKDRIQPVVDPEMLVQRACVRAGLDTNRRLWVLDRFRAAVSESETASRADDPKELKSNISVLEGNDTPSGSPHQTAEADSKPTIRVVSGGLQ